MMKRALAAALIWLLPALALAAPTTTMPSYTARGFTNDGSTGTTVNKLVKVNSSGNAVITATTDTYGAIGVAYAGAGTSGTVQVISQGVVSCAFDGTATAGHYVSISSSTAGACHDAGTAPPVSSQLIGVVTAGGTGSGTYTVILQLRSTAQSACGDLSNSAGGCTMSTTAGGDLSGTLPSPTVAKVNGVTYPSSPSADTVPVVTSATAGGTTTYTGVTNCSNALTYSTSTHTFGCNASAGTGTVTSVSAGAGTAFTSITGSGPVVIGPLAAGGRLTLTSGTPVLTSTVSAATTIYYTAYRHSFVPTYDGTNMAYRQLCANNTAGACEISAALGSNWSANTNYDWFAYSDSGTLRLCSGPAWTSDTARGTGAGTTELQQFNGIWTNKVSMTCRYANASTVTAAANQATYLGTMRTGSAGQTNFVFGGSSAGGTAALFGVWNAYNRVHINTGVTDTTASWTTSSSTTAALDASNTNRVSFIAGLAEDGPVAAHLATIRCPANCSAGSTDGFGLDSTSAFDATSIAGNNSTTFGDTRSYYVAHAYAPQIGWHFVQALQRADGTNTYTWYGGTLSGGGAFNELRVELEM